MKHSEIVKDFRNTKTSLQPVMTIRRKLREAANLIEAQNNVVEAARKIIIYPTDLDIRNDLINALRSFDGASS